MLNRRRFRRISGQTPHDALLSFAECDEQLAFVPRRILLPRARSGERRSATRLFQRRLVDDALCARVLQAARLPAARPHDLCGVLCDRLHAHNPLLRLHTPELFASPQMQQNFRSVRATADRLATTAAVAACSYFTLLFHYTMMSFSTLLTLLLIAANVTLLASVHGFGRFTAPPEASRRGERAVYRPIFFNANSYTRLFVDKTRKNLDSAAAAQKFKCRVLTSTRTNGGSQAASKTPKMSNY